MQHLTKRQLYDHQALIGNTFSSLWSNFDTCRTESYMKNTEKRILKFFHTGNPIIVKKTVLAEYKQRNRRKCKTLLRLCDNGKDITSEIITCPKRDRFWSRVMINFACPTKEQYYLIVVDSFSKWPDVMKCKNPTFSGTIRFLHGILARFDFSGKILSDNWILYTAKEFKDFL